MRTSFEIVDNQMAAILRQKTPAQRLQIAFGMWEFARNMIRANLRREHPEWSDEEVQRETARRLAAGGNS